MRRTEAAERLRATWDQESPNWRLDEMLDEALASERRLTVERVLAIDPNRLAVCGQDGLAAWVPDARSILDNLATADVDEEVGRIVEVVGNGDETMNVTLDSGEVRRITEAEYLAWPREDQASEGPTDDHR